jgi:hypothetical protein
MDVIDGLNGLSGVACVLAASVAGFLLVNLPQGRIFLGDGGAYLVGLLLALLSVIPAARRFPTGHVRYVRARLRLQGRGREGRFRPLGASRTRSSGALRAYQERVLLVGKKRALQELHGVTMVSTTPGSAR